jgi:hypothetical protein
MTYLQFTNHDPTHWRNLAQQKREMAFRMKTVVARASLINAAEYYDDLAQRAARFANDTSETGRELSESARAEPVSSELQPASEQRALEMVIRQIEQDASAGQSPRDKEKTEPQPGHGPIQPFYVFLFACVIAVVLAIAGYYSLSLIQQPASEAFSTEAVRLN